MSKLARVTEELESLINPTVTTVHEEEEKETSTSIQPEKLSIMKIIEPEESIVLPEIPAPIITPAEVSASIEQEKPTITKIIEPEQSIILSQIPAPITTAAEVEKKVDIVTTEVSY
jgi:hypothetical protein